MKKFLFPFAVLAFMLISCSEVSEYGIQESQSINDSDLFRSAQDVTNIALQIWTKSETKVIEASKFQAIPIANRFAARNTDTPLLYAVSLTDDDGYMLIASPKNVDPLLAIIDTGYYDPIKIESKPELKSIYALAEAYVAQEMEKSATTGKDLPYIPVKFEYYDTITEDYRVGPFVKVHWSQCDPFDKYTSPYPAGCVPLAIASIMTYTEPLQYLITTAPDFPKQLLTLDWAKMRKHVLSGPVDYIGFTCTCGAYHDTMAKFVREIGYLANATYTQGPNTEVTADNAMRVLQELHPNFNFKETSNTVLLYNSIYKYGGVALAGILAFQDPYETRRDQG